MSRIRSWGWSSPWGRLPTCLWRTHKWPLLLVLLEAGDRVYRFEGSWSWLGYMLRNRKGLVLRSMTRWRDLLICTLFKLLNIIIIGALGFYVSNVDRSVLSFLGVVDSSLGCIVQRFHPFRRTVPTNRSVVQFLSDGDVRSQAKRELSWSSYAGS